MADDTISPVGGTPLAFDSIPTPGVRVIDSTSALTGDRSKNVTDLLFGLTQVIDRDSVLQFNVGLSHSDGYHNDPYKIISVVDANGDPAIANEARNLSLALYENRPDTRTRQSLYAQYKRLSLIHI